MTAQDEAGAIVIVLVLGLVFSSSIITASILTNRWEKEAIANKVGTYNSDGKFEWVKP